MGHRRYSCTQTSLLPETGRGPRTADRGAPRWRRSSKYLPLDPHAPRRRRARQDPRAHRLPRTGRDYAGRGRGRGSTARCRSRPSVLEEGGNLADAADALAADSEASNEVESLPLEPGRSDVVRLMNLHKAKGLEAAVVFLADPCGGVNATSRRPHRARRHQSTWLVQGRRSTRGKAVRRASTLLGQHTDWEKHEQAEQPYPGPRAEPAATTSPPPARATMLVVSRHAGNARNPAWGDPRRRSRVSEGASRPATVKVASPKPATCSVQAQAAAAEARAAADSRVNQPSWSITSATAEAKHIGKMTRAERARGQ